MKGILKGMQVEVKNNDRVLLKDGQTATVVGDYSNHVVVKTDLGEVKPITMNDIAEIIQTVVKTVNFFIRIWRMFFPSKAV